MSAPRFTPQSDRVREERIDVLRGFALWVIVANHIIGNRFVMLTPISWGWFDMADLFVFLSGYVTFPSLIRMVQKSGWTTVTYKTVRRVMLLYAAYVGTGTVLVWMVRCLGSGLFLGDISEILLLSTPSEVPWKVASLRWRVSHLSILPLYILLLSAAPVWLWLTGCRRGLLCAGSLLLWGLVQVFPGEFHWPETWPGQTYYNPLAWQVLFCLGGYASHLTDSQRGGLARSTFSMGSLFIMMSILAAAKSFGPLPFFPDDKSNLGWPRLLHFLTFAALGGQLLPRFHRAYRRPILSAMACCGRHSLAVYCVGALIAVGASYGRIRLGGGLPADVLMSLCTWAGCWCTAVAAQSLRRWRMSDPRPALRI